MEITCQQCSTLFMVDVGLNPGSELEVVCPSCFQLYRVQLPTTPKRQEPAGEGRTMRGRPLPGEGGVAERLRDGFTLHFELRHPSRQDVYKLNPFAIKQRIRAGQLDGTEEFRENQGRWFRVGEHPEFARLFQLKGLAINTESVETPGGSQRRFAGWKQTLPTAQEEPKPSKVGNLPEPLFSKALPLVQALPEVTATRRARLLWVGAGLIGLVAVGIAFFLLR